MKKSQSVVIAKCEEPFKACWRGVITTQGSHFSQVTKFHDISMIFPGFWVNFQVFRGRTPILHKKTAK